MNSLTPSLTELEIRLGKLERQNRRLKRLGLLFLLVAGSGFLLVQALRKPLNAAPSGAMPEASYDTLVVHRLELRDKAGNLRGLWSVENEVPLLALYDPAGRLRAALGVGVGGSYLTLLDAAGKAGVTVDVHHLMLVDTASMIRAELGVKAGGTHLTLADTAGKVRAELAVTAKGPNLVLFDPAGKFRAWLSEDVLSVQDPEGFQAVVGVTNIEAITTGERHTTSAAAVTLFGKDGKVIWRAP